MAVSKLLTKNKKLLNRATKMFDDVTELATDATKEGIKNMGGRWKSSSNKVKAKIKSNLDSENLINAIQVNNLNAPKKLSFVNNSSASNVAEDVIDSLPKKESKILNPSRAKKDANFVKPSTKDLTDSSFARISIGQGQDFRNIAFNNIEGSGYAMKDGTFIPSKLTGSYSNLKGDPVKTKVTSHLNPVVETKESLEQLAKEKKVYDRASLRKQQQQQKRKKSNPDNWVYKAAAAGVGGGLILSMANNKGQQSNQQLYGQGGY